MCRQEAPQKCNLPVGSRRCQVRRRLLRLSLIYDPKKNGTMYVHTYVCVSGQESTRSRLPIGLLINRPPTLPRCVAHKKRQMKFKLQFRLLCVCVVCCHLVPYKWSLSSKKLATTTTTKTAPTLSPARPLHCSMCQAIRQSPLASYSPFICLSFFPTLLTCCCQICTACCTNDALNMLPVPWSGSRLLTLRLLTWLLATFLSFSPLFCASLFSKTSPML